MTGDVAVSRLWDRVAVSTDAACQSSVPGPSHVLTAMSLPDWAREGAVRIGLGKMNTAQEVEEAGALIAAALSSAEPRPEICLNAAATRPRFSGHETFACRFA